MTDPDFTKIHGLSDRIRMPRCGIIRLGTWEEKGVGGGKDLPHFVFYPDVLDEFPRLLEIYADKKTGAVEPTELRVLLVGDGIHDVFPQSRRLYSQSKGLRCIGNARQARRWKCAKCGLPICQCKEAGFTNEVIPCEDSCPYYQKGDCVDRGILRVMLPDVTMDGLWWIRTKSKTLILDVNSDLAWIRMLRGTLRGAPATLRRVAKKIKDPSGRLRQHWPLRISFAGDPAELLKRSPLAASGRAAAALPAAEVESPVPETDVVYDDEPAAADVVDRNGWGRRRLAARVAEDLAEAEAAAGIEGDEAPAPPSGPPPLRERLPVGELPVGTLQKRILETAFRKRVMSVRQVQEALAKVGVASLDALTAEEADAMIAEFQDPEDRPVADGFRNGDALEEISAALDDPDLFEAVKGALGAEGLDVDGFGKATDKQLEKVLGKVRDLRAAKEG